MEIPQKHSFKSFSPLYITPTKSQQNKEKANSANVKRCYGHIQTKKESMTENSKRKGLTRIFKQSLSQENIPNKNKFFIFKVRF